MPITGARHFFLVYIEVYLTCKTELNWLMVRFVIIAEETETPREMWIRKKNRDVNWAEFGHTTCRPCSPFWLALWVFSMSRDSHCWASNTVVRIVLWLGWMKEMRTNQVSNCLDSIRQLYSPVYVALFPIWNPVALLSRLSRTISRIQRHRHVADITYIQGSSIFYYNKAIKQ